MPATQQHTIIDEALEAGRLDQAELAWRDAVGDHPGDPHAWALGVRLAGWRGDAEAVAARLAQGRRAWSEVPADWRARHALALAAGRAHLRLGAPRRALPLLGEALGQTEFAPLDPASVQALAAVAEAHALAAAPRKAAAQVVRAAERLRELGLQRGALARPLRVDVRWVAALAEARRDAGGRRSAARRLLRLAQLSEALGRTLHAAALRLDAALVAGDADGTARARAALERSGAHGALGRSALLVTALSSGPATSQRGSADVPS